MLEELLWTAAKVAGVLTLFNFVWFIYLINKNFDLITEALREYVKRGKRHGK